MHGATINIFTTTFVRNLLHSMKNSMRHYHKRTCKVPVIVVRL